MAIDIQQPNYSGLVAIAGKSAPLNIAPTGALGLQALQQGQANQASLRDAALRQQAIQQQGMQGLLSNMTQNRALDMQNMQQQRQGLLAKNAQAFEQQKLGMQSSQFQDEMGLKRDQMALQGQQAAGDADLKNRILAEDVAKRQMVELMADKKEKIQEKGAFASYGLIAMKGAKSSEEAQQIKMEFLREAGEKKLMSPEELKAASQMPISQFQNALKYKVMQFGQVKEYRDMMDAQAPAAASSSGTQISFNEDGSIASYSSTPTMGTKTEIQKDIKNNEKAMAQIEKLQKDYDPSYFTFKGQADASTSKFAEKSKGTPGLEGASNLAASRVTGKSPKERAQFIEKRSQYINNIEQVFNTYKKEITGAAAGEREIEMLRKSFLNGDMSPSEFQGAMEQVVSKYKSEGDINKSALTTGIDVSPSSTGLTQYLKAKGYSDEEINAALGGK